MASDVLLAQEFRGIGLEEVVKELSREEGQLETGSVMTRGVAVDKYFRKNP